MYNVINWLLILNVWLVRRTGQFFLLKGLIFHDNLLIWRVWFMFFEIFLFKEWCLDRFW